MTFSEHFLSVEIFLESKWALSPGNNPSDGNHAGKTASCNITSTSRLTHFLEKRRSVFKQNLIQVVNTQTTAAYVDI
jgi:hypothetical protein